MKKTLLNLFTVAFITINIGLYNLHAQESIIPSGGNASGIGGSVSYSVGQIVHTTNSGTTGSVAQGVQQPFEISVVTTIEEAKGITLQCSAYPNPTTDFLILEAENYQVSELSYQLYDTNGKLIESNKIASNITNIDTKMLAPATYFLKVILSNNEIKTFKIVKY